MAKKKYRVNYGSHWIPNPEFKLDEKGVAIGDARSHVEATAGEIIELDEARAEQFTKVFFGQPAKLVPVSDSAGVPEVNTGGPYPPTPPTPAKPPPAAAPATAHVQEAPKHTGVAGKA
jgi:hypothetical protein